MAVKEIHETINIIIKDGIGEVEVDEVMVPVIEYVNQFSSAVSLYSCEGYKSVGGITRLPYICFRCNRKADLQKIEDFLDK
jgi:tRNA(Phe) wybutosine-synthesizing methylase Tyw3